jgi:hypothetical protein
MLIMALLLRKFLKNCGENVFGQRIYSGEVIFVSRIESPERLQE